VREFADIDELRAAVGEDLGCSEWLTVDQHRIDQFADATDDHQWIHVDPQRAADGPYGTTIAHGFLTLSLAPKFGWETYNVGGVSRTINYGVNKVRFPAPVPAGARVRSSSRLSEVTDVPGGVQAVVQATVELEGSEKPACVLEIVFRYYV
jgi:acyl dehydratase